MPTLEEIASSRRIAPDALVMILQAGTVPLDDPMMAEHNPDEPWNYPRKTAAGLVLALELANAGMNRPMIQGVVHAVIQWVDANRIIIPTPISLVLQIMDGASILISYKLENNPTILALLHLHEDHSTPSTARVITIANYRE